jgi:hypothetical protein
MKPKYLFDTLERLGLRSDGMPSLHYSCFTAGDVSMRVVLIVAAILSIPFLTGCIDLYVTGSEGIDRWVFADARLWIHCEGYSSGTVFQGTGVTTDTGHWTINLMEMGANPFEAGYGCQVTNLDGCCGEVQILFGAFPMIYPVHVGCRSHNTCDDPY